MINAIQCWELILSHLKASYPGRFAAARDRAASLVYSWQHNGWMRRGVYDTAERDALMAELPAGHAALLAEVRNGKLLSPGGVVLGYYLTASNQTIRPGGVLVGYGNQLMSLLEE